MPMRPGIALYSTIAIVVVGNWKASGDELTPSAAPSTELEQIVVTAQKRSENAVNVPISITAVSGDSLQTLGIPDVTSLPQVVPGLRIDFDGPSAQPTIRGVGSALLGPGLSPNVATYVDGIIRPSTITTNIPFADVNSIEVLKGPQGTLFGRNATGGAILITTQNPTFDPTLAARASFGNYNTVSAALTGSTGITDSLAASISLAKQQSDGFVKNLLNGSDAGQYNDYGIRTKLLYRPSDAIDIVLSYEHMNLDDNRTVALGDYQGWSDGVLVPGAIIPQSRGYVANDFPDEQTSSVNDGTIKATFDLGWGTLTSLTGGQWEDDFYSVDEDGSSAPVVGVDGTIKDHTITQEIDLNSESNDSIHWVTGLYYYNNGSEWPTLQLSLGGAPLFNYLSTDVRTQSYAVFGDVTKSLADGLFLTAGLRYGRDDVEAKWQFTGAGPKAPSHNWSDTTPRVVLRYETDAQSNVYASYSQGFKAGIIDAPSDSTTPISPEKIDAYEIGYKTAHSRWRWDAAAYLYNYKDLQVSTYTVAGPLVFNAANSRIYGLDTSVTSQIAEGFVATLAAAYTHARYLSFPDAANYSFSPTEGITVGTKDASGSQMERAPEFQGDITLKYTLAAMGGKLDMSGLYSYESRVYFDPVEFAHQGGYGVLNLRAQWNAPAGHWYVAIFGKNVTDKKYVNQVLPDSAFFGQTYGEPATGGVEFGIKY